MKNIFNLSRISFILLWVALILIPASCSKVDKQTNKNTLSDIDPESIVITGEDASPDTKTTLNLLVTSWVMTADKVGVYSPQARPTAGGADGVTNTPYTASTSAAISNFTGAMYWGTVNPHLF